MLTALRGTNFVINESQQEIGDWTEVTPKSVMRSPGVKAHVDLRVRFWGSSWAFVIDSGRKSRCLPWALSFMWFLCCRLEGKSESPDWFWFPSAVSQSVLMLLEALGCVRPLWRCIRFEHPWRKVSRKVAQWRMRAGLHCWPPSPAVYKCSQEDLLALEKRKLEPCIKVWKSIEVHVNLGLPAWYLGSNCDWK